MSSHREAPEISKDSVADSTDLYAFVSPERPNTVTLIANYIPQQDPAAGPNFFEFGDDVVYRINIDNNGDGKADVVYEWRFSTSIRNPDTFLYSVGPIESIDSPNWIRPQTYELTRTVRGEGRSVLGRDLPVPPCNVGPRSTPRYARLAGQAVVSLAGGVKAFAGQRLDPFYADLGSIFDLGALRPLQDLHLIPSAAAAGRNSLRDLSVHTLAIQVPIRDLTRDGAKPSNVASEKAVIGVWTSAHRQKGTIRRPGGNDNAGPLVQVSRLGNPLFNEVLVPMSRKDRWNKQTPDGDSAYARYVARPELAGLLPVLYPGAFPNLAAYGKRRADLLAILLTGIPSGVVPGFQNFTGTTQADMLRLNVAIPPASSPNSLGLVGGDAAGFPNGRRVADDVVAIELKAVAGATIPLVDPSFTPDGAAALLDDGTEPIQKRFLKRFPYVGHPTSGYEVTPHSRRRVVA